MSSTRLPLLWPGLNAYPIHIPIQLEVAVALTLMLVVANLANTKLYRKPEKVLKPWNMGTHMKVLGESYPMNTRSSTRIGF